MGGKWQGAVPSKGTRRSASLRPRGTRRVGTHATRQSAGDVNEYAERECQNGHRYQPVRAMAVPCPRPGCGAPAKPTRPLYADPKRGGRVTRDGVQRHDAGGIARIA